MRGRLISSGAPPQIEGETFLRAGILVGIGVVLWLINEFFLRRTTPAAAG